MTTTLQAASRRTKASRGFTVIEMMVTVVILAVLAGLAVPGMQELLRRGSLSSAAGELHAAVAKARQEAIRRGTFVSVTPLTGVDWSSGYQIFVNPQNKTVFTAGDIVGAGTSIVTSEVLSKRDATGWGFVTWPSLSSDGQATRTYFTFDDTGRPRNSDGSNLRTTDPSRVRVCISGGACRELLVDHLGRVQILRN